MKIVFAIAAIIFLACAQSNKGADGHAGNLDGKVRTGKNTGDLPKSCSQMLSAEDARNIMGERCYQEGGADEDHKNVSIYQCAYKAKTQHQGKPRPAALYLLIEKFADLSTAQKKYSSTKKANEHNGIEPLADLGDEAYFHSDKLNFYFVMVRKGNVVFNMKLNLLTATSSLENFNAVAKGITNDL